MSTFGTPSGSGNFNPRVWKPIYLRILRLYWMGEQQVEIARRLGVSTATVGSVINSDRGKEILTQLQNETFDSMLAVMNEAQAVAPELLQEKIKLALYSPDERIRTRNTSDLLAIAGHVPLHRVSIERPDPLDKKYENITPEQLKVELLKIKDSTSQAPPDRGPDGNLVN